MATYTGGDGPDTLQGGVEWDALRGGGGDDRLSGGDGRNLLEGDDGDPATPDGDDVLSGGDDRDVLIGGRGDDTLSGGGGNDFLYTGVGSGRQDYWGSPSFIGGDDTLDGGNDVLNGGGGRDTGWLIFGGRAGGVTLDNSELDRVNVITTDGVASGSVTGVELLVVFGGAGDDQIRAGADIDHLYGAAGDDSLSGGGGIDFLQGGVGNDRLDGGDGFDFASEDAAVAGLVIDLNIAGPQDTRGGGVDSFVAIEGLIGTRFSDRLTGDDGANTLSGGYAGSDVLLGRGGDDSLQVHAVNSGPAETITLDGGSGADHLAFGASGRYLDRVTLVGGDGADTISSYGLGVGLVDAGAGDDDVRYATTGGAYTITLGAGADRLELMGDNVTVRGSTANVVTDFMTSVGGDRLALRNWTSALDLYASNQNPFATGHLRLIQSGKDALLQVDSDGGGDEFVTLLRFRDARASAFTNAHLDGFAAAGDDVLIGGPSADVLEGLAGNDRLESGAANDTLRGGLGRDTLIGGDGSDTADYRDRNTPIFVALNASNTTTAKVNGVAEDSLTSIERIWGGSAGDTLIGDALENYLRGEGGNDVLRGGGGDDHLVGDSGDDVLEGGAGDDILSGGAGVDRASYYRSASGVTVSIGQWMPQETGGGGVDLLTGVENLTGSRYGDRLTGDEGNNVLNGLGGGDILVGGGGVDRLIGGLGRDTLTGGSGADTFVFNTLAETGASAATADRITDLEATDVVDLRAIDASGTGAGAATFTRVSGNFTSAGQMRLTLHGRDTWLELNTDGDSAAEAVIVLTGDYTGASVDDGWLL